MPVTRMPVKPRIDQTPPMVMVMSWARSVPMASKGKSMSASARWKGPGWSDGKDEVFAGGNGRTATTRAATRAFSSSVSPGRGTKVPVDWSAAILAASFSGLPSVSMR